LIGVVEDQYPYDGTVLEGSLVVRIGEDGETLGIGPHRVEKV
jgi:hypothetical protein